MPNLSITADCFKGAQVLLFVGRIPKIDCTWCVASNVTHCTKVIKFYIISPNFDFVVMIITLLLQKKHHENIMMRTIII